MVALQMNDIWPANAFLFSLIMLTQTFRYPACLAYNLQLIPHPGKEGVRTPLLGSRCNHTDKIRFCLMEILRLGIQAY